MLDKLSNKLLKYLNLHCAQISYSILELNEILKELAINIDLEVLIKYLTFLSENEYIDIKYIDDKQVCLAIMPKGRRIEEKRKEDTKQKKKTVGLAVIIGAVSAICGFLGALLGSIMIGIMR